MSNVNVSQNMRFAGWCALASALVSAFGVVFLVIFFAGFYSDNAGLQVFGPMNDALIVVQYLLALPVVLALHRMIGLRSPMLNSAFMLLGLAGIGIVVVFQTLLVAGVMSFDEEVWFATAGMFIFGAWTLIMNEQLRRTAGLRNGRLIGILTLFYFGFPWWALVIGRRLLSGEGTPAEPGAVLSGEAV